MDRFMRQVATSHALGHGTIGAKKTREQKIAYNRFIIKWRQRISTAVQRESHTASQCLRAATTHPAGSRIAITRQEWKTNAMPTPGAGSAPGVQRPPPWDSSLSSGLRISM
eukprot:CAMPEP_0182910612 /NCGR_PEP_ID=MMETSP0034_2-20130328/36424_1 /TAXON_ID=156128 /ORGANISM="Nephroselmis pyriformis, Strain CCMP717" /LENGTH=110 /DNA_ID=CAMNT_0025046997 /DNA_START=555 /DNA_END=888 /DNA_ORIENTATION=-